MTSKSLLPMHFLTMSGQASSKSHLLIPHGLFHLLSSQTCINNFSSQWNSNGVGILPKRCEIGGN